jgi:hypothetical protein
MKRTNHPNSVHRFQISREEWIEAGVPDEQPFSEWNVVHVTHNGKIRTGLDGKEAISWLQLHWQLVAVEGLHDALDRCEQAGDAFERAAESITRALRWRPWGRR